MNIWILLTIICGVALIPLIMWGVKEEWYNMFAIFLTVTFIALIIAFGTLAITNGVEVKKEAIRQEKEREQIIYQIEHITETTDKIKLNEWILTYNDWVNDVNTNKEMWGWFSWYKDLDMSKHTIIDLV